ncbi:hypothetical protein M0R45_015206 [Rubus argutus]|uniref:Uncharacterized protein n=1 Tax=Rubus argutus TaxID=59490 RepID=A0AAW1XQZ8_RUBAR
MSAEEDVQLDWARAWSGTAITQLGREGRRRSMVVIPVSSEHGWCSVKWVVGGGAEDAQRCAVVGTTRFWVDEEMPRIDCGGAGLATERATIVGEAAKQVGTPD